MEVARAFHENRVVVHNVERTVKRRGTGRCEGVGPIRGLGTTARFTLWNGSYTPLYRSFTKVFHERRGTSRRTAVERRGTHR